MMQQPHVHMRTTRQKVHSSCKYTRSTSGLVRETLNNENYFFDYSANETPRKQTSCYFFLYFSVSTANRRYIYMFTFLRL